MLMDSTYILSAKCTRTFINMSIQTKCQRKNCRKFIYSTLNTKNFRETNFTKIFVKLISRKKDVSSIVRSILNIILTFSRSPQYQSFGIGTTMAAYVGQTKDTLRAKTSTKNSNFPNGINGDTEVRFINSTIYILLQGFINCLLLFWITQPTS